MRQHALSFLLVASAIALVQGANLRNVKLHGFGTGTINADPLNLDFMGMPITVGGKGQGDLKGAMEVEIPASSGLEKYFKGNGADFSNDPGFYGNYPEWMKHHSRYIAGENVYDIKPLDHINPAKMVIDDSQDNGIILTSGSHSHSHHLQPLEILNPSGQGGAMYMLPLHTVHK